MKFTSGITAQSSVEHISIGRPFRRTPWVTGAVLAAAIAVGAIWWFEAQWDVSTNDARIEGHIHPLNARIAGTVVWVNPTVEDTYFVHAGTVLARLDPNDYQPIIDRLQGEVKDRAALLESARLNVPITDAQTASRLNAARAAVSEAEAELATDMADVAAAQANLGAAEATHRRAEEDRRRYELLVTSHEISRSEYDQFATASRTTERQQEAAKAALVAAQRKVEAAQEQIAERKADVLAAKAAPELMAAAKANVDGASGQLIQAQAALHTAELNLSYTQIVAPVSGIISRKSIEVGQHVQAGDLLLALVPLNEIWVMADYKETQLNNVRAGQPVTVHVDTDGRNYAAHVESIGGDTGSMNSPLPPENATGNFVKVIQRIPVRIRLDETPDLHHPLLPGMSVEPTVHVK